MKILSYHLFLIQRMRKRMKHRTGTQFVKCFINKNRKWYKDILEIINEMSAMGGAWLVSLLQCTIDCSGLCGELLSIRGIQIRFLHSSDMCKPLSHMKEIEAMNLKKNIFWAYYFILCLHNIVKQGNIPSTWSR